MLKVFEMGFICSHSLVSGKVSILSVLCILLWKNPKLAARYLAQLKLQIVGLLLLTRLHLPSAVSDLRTLTHVTSDFSWVLALRTSILCFQYCNWYSNCSVRALTQG